MLNQTEMCYTFSQGLRRRKRQAGSLYFICCSEQIWLCAFWLHTFLSFHRTTWHGVGISYLPHSPSCLIKRCSNRELVSWREYKLKSKLETKRQMDWCAAVLASLNRIMDRQKYWMKFDCSFFLSESLWTPPNDFFLPSLSCMLVRCRLSSAFPKENIAF